MKNKILHLILGIILMAMVTACGEKKTAETEVRKGNYRIVDNTIVFDEPQRIEGQKSVLQFTVDPIENVRFGFIGDCRCLVRHRARPRRSCANQHP